MLTLLLALALQDDWQKENGPFPDGWEKSKNGRIELAGILGSRRWKSKASLALFARRHLLTNEEIWDDEGRLVRSWTFTACAVSPDAARAVTSSGAELHLWDLATGEKKATWDHGMFDARSLAWSADGKLVASGGIDRKARVWEVETGKTIASFECEDEVGAIAFSPDAKKVVTAALNGSVTVWSGGEAIAAWKAKGDDLFVIDARVYLATPEGLLAWDLETGKPVELFAEAGTIHRIAFSPDRRWAITSGHGMIRTWDWKESKVLASWSLTIFGSYPDDVNAIAITADGARAATVSMWGGLALWNATTGARIGADVGHASRIFDLVVHEGRIYTFDLLGVVLRWNPDKLLEEKRWPFRAPVHGLAANGDGVRVVLYASQKSRAIFDLGSDRVIANPRETFDRLTSYGEKFLSIELDRIRVIDAKKFQVEEEWKLAGSRFAAVSPDGSCVAVGGERGTTLLRGGKEVWSRTSKEPVHALSFDAKGERLAELTRDTLSLVDPKSGKDTNWKAEGCELAAIYGDLVVTVGRGALRLWNFQGEEQDSILIESDPWFLTALDGHVAFTSRSAVWIYRIR